MKTGFLLVAGLCSPIVSHFPVLRLFSLLVFASVVLFLVAASSPCPEVKKSTVSRGRPPAGDPIGIIQSLWKGFVQVAAQGGPGPGVVALHLEFLQCIISSNKDDDEIPVGCVSLVLPVGEN